MDYIKKMDSDLLAEEISTTPMVPVSIISIPLLYGHHNDVLIAASYIKYKQTLCPNRNSINFL